MRRFVIAVFLIVVLAILMAACRPPRIEPCRHAEESQRRPLSEEEVEARGETDRYLEGLLWVSPGQGGAAAEQIGGRAIDLTDPDRVAEVFNDWHCPGDNRGLTSDDLSSVVSGDNESWSAVVGAADLIELPQQLSVDAAIDRLDGFGPLPIQLLGTANHWGAMPGVEPVDLGPITVQESGAQASANEGAPGVVAIVDTGFYGHNGVVKGAGLDDVDDLPRPGTSLAREGMRDYGWQTRLLHRVWQGPVDRIDDYRSGSAVCDTSHGEFVASIMRRVNPEVTLYGFNAFPTRLGKNGNQARCWETSELAVALTVARMEAADIDFDAVNMSLGTFPHDESDTPSPMPALDAQLGGTTAPTWAGTVYASSGNRESPIYDGAPIAVYPAAYPSVVPVGAMAETGAWMLWEESVPPAPLTPVPGDPGSAYAWVKLLAPGCLIMGQGGPVAEAWQVWSGSSFASPLAAIYGAQIPSERSLPAVALGYDDLPPGMVLLDGGVPDPGHCPRADQLDQ